MIELPVITYTNMYKWYFFIIKNINGGEKYELLGLDKILVWTIEFNSGRKNKRLEY